MKRVVVLTGGLWKLRREIGLLTGMEVLRWDVLPRPTFDAVAGWGYARTAGRARRLAARSGQPYLALEDGLVRSVKPGPGQPPMSMVVDGTGIFYAADQPSDLTGILADLRWFTPEMAERAARCLGQLRRLRLSKYNSGPDRTPEELGLSLTNTGRVLVIDQVQNDASVSGAGANTADFAKMLGGGLGRESRL
jgi:capsular polysaccharide export protein